MANVQILIDAKVAGLGQVTELDAGVQKLGTSTSTLGTQLDGTTTKLNASGAAHAATAKEAQALEGNLAKTTTQVDAAGVAHAKATTSAQGLGTQLGTVGQQAKTAGTEAEALGGKLTGLQNSTALVKTASTDANLAIQDLAAANTQSAAAAASSSSAMQSSSTAIADLAAVDGTLGNAKKKTTAAVKEEGAALEKVKVAHEAHAEAVLKGIAATGEFGEAGVKASEKLSSLSGVLGGAGGVSASLAGFVVGAGAAVAIAKGSIETFASLGESVIKYQRATGDSAEASSRMVSVFTQMGVGGDGASNAMFNLAKRIEGIDGAATKSSKSLAEVGVQVAKTKDGTTDLDKTLGNVADAYSGASSATERDAIATAAFGKSARDMIPILEQGSAGIRDMANQARLLFDQQQLEQIHQYNVQQQQFGQEAAAIGMGIGGLLLPQMNTLGAKLIDVGAGWDSASRAEGGLNITGAQSIALFLQRYAAGVQGASQSRQNAAANEAEGESLKRLNEDLQKEEQARQDLLTADVGAVTASLGLQRAAQGVTNAQKTLADETLRDAEYSNKHQAAIDKVAAAQANLTAVVRAHGPASLAAKEAQDKLNAARDAGKTVDQQNADAAGRLAGEELNLKDAMLRDSQAAVQAAEQQAKLSGGHLSAKDAAAAQAAELEKLKASAGGTLPAELQTLLDKLNGFHDVTTTIHMRLDDQTGGQRMSAGTQVLTAEGGIFTRPTLTWVGEAGPEAVIPLRAGNTMPGASPLPSGMSTLAPSRTYNITINGANLPPLDEERLAATLRQYEQLYA
jgi:hypothetical protein